MAATTDAVRADVTASVARLTRHGVSCHIATSLRAASLNRRYDTLVFRIQRDRPREDLSASRAIRSDKAPAARVISETLCLWHHASRCEGMAFHENFAFWVDALGAEMMNSVHPLNVSANVAFPRVVLHWDFRVNNGEHWLAVPIEDELALLHERLLDMFLQPKDKHEPDKAVPPKPPIECFVRFRLRKQHTVSEPLFMHIAAQAAKYVCDKAELVWTGIEILGRHYHERRREGLDNSDLQLLTEFFTVVPPSMRVNLQLPRIEWRFILTPQRSPQILSRILVPFVHRAYGFAPAKMVGHLKVLDLLHGFRSTRNRSGSRVDVATVCSLVPFMTSLEELRVEITVQRDLVWLAYAVFHPRASQSKWRTLAIHVARDVRERIDWSVWTKMFHARSRLLTLKEWPASGASGSDAEEASTCEWATAMVANRAKVYDSADKAVPLVTLNSGDFVEVCDPGTETSGQDASAMVAVVVPGYCVGWMERGKLSRIRRTVNPEPPMSSITSLTLDDPVISPAEQEVVLRLMGTSLRHLRTSGPDWFQRADLRTVLPNLESLNNCQFTRELMDGDLCLLANVKTLELCCTVETLSACCVWLSRHRHFPAVRELFLRVHDTVDTPSMPSHLVSSLLVGKHSLRRVSVILTHERRQMMRYKPSQSDPVSVAQRKVAFLSVLHHAKPVDAISNMDTSVVRLVFDYLGLSLDHLGIFVMPKLLLEDLLVRNEPETPGDAWYDK